MAGDQHYGAPYGGGYVFQTQTDFSRACNCRGPQGMDPVCPCRMPAYTRRKRGEAAISVLTVMAHLGKPVAARPAAG